MKGLGRWMPAFAVALAGLVAMGAAPGGAAGKGSRLEAVTFLIRNRVFHDFSDVHKVKLNQDFPLGDTEYSARVVRYIPDFQMDLKAHKIFSLSSEPRNPAFQVVVRRGKTPQDTSWAFLKSPPHFGARSYFAFQVLRIEFKDRAPMTPDTSSVPPARMSVPAHADSADNR